MEYQPKHLDDRGRCCGRKPMRYQHTPRFFCPRCDAAYDIETGAQIENWAFERSPNGFVPRGLSTMTVAQLIDDGKLVPV